MLALEVWCVRNYELTRSSPSARELYESAFEFAGEVANESAAAFDAILAEILEPLVQKQSLVKLSAVELARLVSSAILGFKATTKGTNQLRATLRSFVSLVLASLGRVA
jgi:hypothetical protein